MPLFNSDYIIYRGICGMATVKKSNKKKIIAAISIVLVIAIIGTVIGVLAKSKKKETVSLTTIGTGEISESVSATGKVSAGTTKEYKVGAVATVKEVFVKVGDKVSAGDKLATFDTSTLDSQRKQLSGTYQQAKKSYKQSVSDQKTAKKNLADVNSKIEDAQKQLEKLEREAVTQATSRVTITFPSTTTTTRPTTTRPTTASTSATTTTTTEPVTYPATVEGLVQALTDLVNTLNRLSNDIETTNALVRVVMQEIANQLENGNLDPERIAQAVGDAVAKAIKEGIIDETKLIIESGVLVDMIETAVKNIDWAAVGSSIASSPNVQVATAQLNLAALYAQQKVFQLEASDDTVFAKKQVMDSAKSALDAIDEANAELVAGWTAAFDGTITACDIYPGETTSLLASGITLENLDSMVVTLSLGEYDIHKVKVGMPATINSAYGTYSGEIISKAPVATGGSSGSMLDTVGSMAGISGLSSLTSSGAGVEVQVSVNDPDENIIAGFDADVTIAVGDHQNIVTVPIESIVLQKTGTYVYLYNEKDKTVSKTLIETGAVSDSAYEVKSGIKAGDKIVSTPSSDYEEDTFEVKVK